MRLEGGPLVEELDEDVLRDETIRQLKMNLDKCYEMMTDERLDVKTREQWAHKHAYTAQVLNQLLRDRQNRIWQKRLDEIEDYGEKMEAVRG